MLRSPLAAQALLQPSPDEAELIGIALERARRSTLRTQRLEGEWESMGDMGPMPTCQVLICLKSLGALDPNDARDAARYLRAQQNADGSFLLRPYAQEGDLGTTACAWAALQVCDPEGSAEAIARAHAWFSARGGLPQVIQLVNRGDVSAVFVALAGLLDPKLLPCPNIAAFIIPGVTSWLGRRFHAGILMTAMQLSLIVRRLRGEFGQDGSDRDFMASCESKAAITLMSTFQNVEGSWNSNTVQTALALPGLLAAGLPTSDERVQRGVSWLLDQRERDADGLRFNAFGSAVWSTAFNIRALLASGMPANTPEIELALAWLVDAQLTIPQPEIDNRNPGAPRTGGWGFQKGNHTMADCDDAGVVLSALGQALKATDREALTPQVRARVESSVEKGVAWLRGMQNPDGGWSAFVWDLPARRHGPMFQKTPDVPMDDLWAMFWLALDPPRELGDCSTEDVTSRILHGLGEVGYTLADPMVKRGVEFLKAQQMSNGSFWGRWGVNYLTGTSFVLMGLKSVGADLREEWVRRAIQWVLSKQNPDGGFGESPESYREPTRAGEGPSNAPLTGLVLQALMEVGEVDSPEVRRGIQYLLAHQLADGTWHNGDYLHSNLPPDTYYVLPEAARYYPCEALARYLTAQPDPEAPPAPMHWSHELLDLMRHETDVPADQAIEEIFRAGDVAAVNQLMGAIFRSDQPIPPGLPPAALRYFEDTAQLPAWADQEKILLAQQFFTRTGWFVAAGLFCSSLPQAYAAAKGAHVLTQTMGMTKNTRQRIFETAQFLFDVLDLGGLGPQGRGVRAAQKIRLLHAAIRQLIRSSAQPAWDDAFYGKPVNQEDLAGTLMTFSVVTLDAVERLGQPVSPAEADAWIHTWNVVGHLLGVRPELFPRSRSDGEGLMDAIRDRQWGRSDDGKKLIVPLVGLMQGYIPGNVFDGLPIALIRHLSGEQCADLLGLPQADWTRTVLNASLDIGALLKGLTPSERDAKIFAYFTHLIMKGIVAAERDGKEAAFRIPQSLTRTIDPDF